MLVSGSMNPHGRTVVWSVVMSRFVLLAVLLAVALFADAAEAEVSLPTLHGFCAIGAANWVSLHSVESGQRWVRVGAPFGGFRVERWNAMDESVILRRDDELFVVPFGDREARPLSERSAEALPETAAICDNLRRLAVNAFQYLLEQGSDRVSVAELVGPDKPIFRVESVAGEDYADIFFLVGRDGPEISVAGKSVPLLPSHDPLVIRVGPTQTLATIGARLHIALAKLAALNPRLAAGPAVEWTSVRLQ